MERGHIQGLPNFFEYPRSHPLNISVKFNVRSFPIPEIIGEPSKIWGVHAPYSPKFLKGFCSHGPYEYTCQI